MTDMGVAPRDTPRDGEHGWYWALHRADDVGTEYLKHNTSSAGNTYGKRDLGAQIPAEATKLYDQVLKSDPRSAAAMIAQQRLETLKQ